MLMVNDNDWARRVLVCYGRTRAYLDAVRYLTSDSSGKMGRALIAAAHTAHLEVISLRAGGRINRSQSNQLRSNHAVLQAIKTNLPQVKYLICLVVLNDYCWGVPAPDKLAKSVVDVRRLRLRLACDVLATVAPHKRKDQVFVGFCLQNQLADLTSARQKMLSKQLDMIVVNDLASVGADTTQVVIVTRTQTHRLPRQTKRLTAQTIIDLMVDLGRQQSRTD